MLEKKAGSNFSFKILGTLEKKTWHMRSLDKTTKFSSNSSFLFLHDKILSTCGDFQSIQGLEMFGTSKKTFKIEQIFCFGLPVSSNNNSASKALEKDVLLATERNRLASIVSQGLDDK